MKKLSTIYLVLFLFLVSCEDEPVGPQVTAPEVLSISPTTGTIGAEVAVTIRGNGFFETTIMSDDDDLILTDLVSSDTLIKVNATISAEAFPKIVNLLLTNTEGTDSVAFSLTPASLEGLVWSTVQDMPTPRYGLSVVAVGGKIYAIGGITEDNNVVATMEIFDPSTNTWSEGVDIPHAVAFAASATIDGKIYIAGGLNFGKTLSTLDVFDPITKSWTSLTDLPSGRTAPGSAGFDGKFYVAGGSADSYLLDNLQSYDVASTNWTLLPHMPRGKATFEMVPSNDRLYAVGGEGEDYPGANISFTPSTNSWSNFPALPTPRRSPMADNFLGNVIVIGGRSSVFLFTVESLNPITNIWSTLTDIPDARDRGGAAVIGNKIYIVGGRNRIDGSTLATGVTLVGEIP